MAILYAHARNHCSCSSALPPAPRAQQRLLDEVLGLLEVAEHAVAVDVQLAAVALGQLGERGFGRRHAGHSAGRERPTASATSAREDTPSFVKTFVR